MHLILGATSSGLQDPRLDKRIRDLEVLLDSYRVLNDDMVIRESRLRRQLEAQAPVHDISSLLAQLQADKLAVALTSGTSYSFCQICERTTSEVGFFFDIIIILRFTNLLNFLNIF